MDGLYPQYDEVGAELAYIRGMRHGLQLADAFRRGPKCQQRRAQAVENLKGYEMAIDACATFTDFSAAKRDNLRDRLIANKMGM